MLQRGCRRIFMTAVSERQSFKVGWRQRLQSNRGYARLKAVDFSERINCDGRLVCRNIDPHYGECTRQSEHFGLDLLLIFRNPREASVRQIRRKPQDVPRIPSFVSSEGKSLSRLQLFNCDPYLKKPVSNSVRRTVAGSG